MKPLIYLFDTNTDVLWAEELAEEAGLTVEVVPAPPTEVGHCGNALRVVEAQASALEELVAEAGIPFRRFGDGA